MRKEEEKADGYMLCYVVVSGCVRERGSDALGLRACVRYGDDMIDDVGFDWAMAIGYRCVKC